MPTFWRSATLMIHRTQRGGLSSPASQPTASVLSGSTGKQTISVRWQVPHSKVRCSTPRSPGEIRASPIRCLQEGHIGRSTMELRITHHPGECYSWTQMPVCSVPDSVKNFCGSREKSRAGDKPGFAAGHPRSRTGSRQADRRRQLDLAVAALVAVDEILKEERDVALLEVAAPPQLLRQIGGDVLGPAFNGVKTNDPNRVLVLAGQKINDDRFQIGR